MPNFQRDILKEVKMFEVIAGIFVVIWMVCVDHRMAKLVKLNLSHAR